MINKDAIAAARHGTVTCGVPERIDRIRGVAKGVRVIAVFKPATARDQGFLEVYLGLLTNATHSRISVEAIARQ